MTTNTLPREGDLDIKPYITELVAQWKIIVAGTFVFGLLAALISLALPSRYEATALIALTGPRYQLEFDPRFSINEETPVEYNAVIDFALSDMVIGQLYEEASQNELLTTDTANIENFKENLRPSSTGTNSSIVLTVESTSPEIAQQLVNIWADIVTNEGRITFGNLNGNSVDFLLQELESTRSELKIAERNLSDFLAENNISILENRLTALQRAQLDLEVKLAQLDSLLTDISTLKSYVESDTSSGEVLISDQLSALLLQVTVFNGDLRNLEINVDGTAPLFSTDKQEYLQKITGLEETLSAQGENYRNQILELEPEILTLEQEKQNIVNQHTNLMMTLTVKQETANTLSQTVEEARISSQDIDSFLKIISFAAVPTEPTSPNLFINIPVGLVFGFLISLIVVLGRIWWRIP